MRISRLALVTLSSLLAAGSPTASQPPVMGPKQVPTGATVEQSGFATIRQVPPSPFPDRLPPSENRPRNEAGYYAQMAGISDAEATRRLAEQRAARPEFATLVGILRAREAGNFTEPRLIHKPDWAYVFYFKRNPEQTLSKYTRNPHFKAAKARYSREELEAISKPWVDRFTQQRLLGGYGSDATYGEVRMDLIVSEAEFRTVAAREGWRLPEPIKLQYSEPVAGPPIAEQVRPLIRIFPQSDRSLGLINQALLRGRIELRDGCLYVTGLNQSDRLAYFAREVALGTDAGNYLVLQTRGPLPRHLGRIGEQFSWAGPIAATETMPMVGELRSRCGNAPLQHVGIPESSRLFELRPWVIDAIAERRKIGRDEAWRRFRACIERREASKSATPVDCDRL